MLSEAEILTALRDCYDPEVKLNLVDLGLIYGITTGPTRFNAGLAAPMGQGHHDADYAQCPPADSSLSR